MSDSSNGNKCAIVGASNKPTCAAFASPPPIFKLNIDCFDEIFDYLSLKYLHSFGQSCRAMQNVAGQYFKRNYHAAETFIGERGILTAEFDHLRDMTRTVAFHRFTQFMSYYYGESLPLRYIASHIDEFMSVKHLYFVCTELNSSKINNFAQILPNVENLQIRQCMIWRDDFYKCLLEPCSNLKRLFIQDDLGYIIYNRGSWLLKTYPKMEHLELTPRTKFKIDQLSTFFAMNPSIRSFCTHSHCLWVNRMELLDLNNCKLNELEIKCLDTDFFFHAIDDLDVCDLCNLLKQLNERGFYKKLHLSIPEMNAQFIDRLPSIHALEKLSIKKLSNANSLVGLTNLRQLAISDCTDTINFEEAAKRLEHLERVLLQSATYDQLLSFVQMSTKLKHIKLMAKDESNFIESIDLIKLNREREKLFGAQKVGIYVSDNVFLAVKWAIRNGNIDLSHVEMRRGKSLRWDYDYSTIRTLH